MGFKDQVALILPFLAVGSVIIALHHEQDMRRMGGLRRYMSLAAP